MESVALSRIKPRSWGRALTFGLVLIVCGAASEIAAFGATIAGRVFDHQAKIAAASAHYAAAQRHTESLKIAAQVLNAAWSSYDAKILRVETGFGEPTANDRAFIANFRARIVDQLTDASPAVALAATGGDIVADSAFQTSRTAFLAAFHDVRNQMYVLAATLTIVLEHPSAMLAVSQSGRFERFFAAEATLENRWTPVARAAQRVSDAALLDEQSAAVGFDAEEHEKLLDALLGK